MVSPDPWNPASPPFPGPGCWGQAPPGSGCGLRTSGCQVSGKRVPRSAGLLCRARADPAELVFPPLWVQLSQGQLCPVSPSPPRVGTVQPPDSFALRVPALKWWAPMCRRRPPEADNWTPSPPNVARHGPACVWSWGDLFSLAVGLTHVSLGM